MHNIALFLWKSVESIVAIEYTIELFSPPFQDSNLICEKSDSIYTKQLDDCRPLWAHAVDNQSFISFLAFRSPSRLASWVEFANKQHMLCVRIRLQASECILTIRLDKNHAMCLLYAHLSQY